MTALNELEKLVPFEKGIVYFMDGNQKPIDYYTIRGMKEDINEYLNYYIKNYDNKHNIFRSKKEVCQSGIDVVVADWNDVEPSTFIKEYVYPQKIRWMLQFMLSDNMGIPRIAFSVTRNDHPFRKYEIDIVKIFAEHLDNLHKNFFVTIDYVSNLCQQSSDREFTCYEAYRKRERNYRINL